MPVFKACKNFVAIGIGKGRIELRFSDMNCESIAYYIESLP
jgi:hypothetical protein